MNRSSYDAQASLDRCHFLANSYLTFLSTLSYGVTKNNLTQLLLPEFADWYALYLLDSNGKMYLENCSHSDPAKTDLIWELNRRFPFSQDSESGPMQVMQTKQPEYVKDVPPPTLSGLFLNRDHVGLLELIGLNSYICVPLVDHETSMGSLFLAVNEMSGRRYGEADAALAADFGKSAAFALVNARTAGTAVAQVHELLDDLDAIVWESDINRSRYTFISKKAENILGYPVTKWLTERNVWQEIIHPADRYQVLSMFSVAVSKGRDLDIEYRAVTQDGRTIWIRDILHIVVDGKGERTGVRGVIIDVTEQHEVMDHLHQHEAELLQSQKRLTSLISGVNAILWESDVGRSTYHFVSEQAFNILGYTADQWLSEKDFWSRLIHPFDRDRITQLYLKAAANGHDEVLEYRVTTAQGQTKWIRDIFHFEKTNNQPISARGIVLDVTDAHEKAETLARNETALRLFYENVKDYAIVMLNNDGFITSWNVAAQKMTGYSVEDAVGQHLDLLFTQEDRAIHAAANEIANVRLTGSVENNRWMMRRDGSRFWCQGVLTALFNQDRQLLGLIKFARDMTEQKLLEDELKKAKEAAEVASETKSQFLANMSHELRTPLGAMIGFADELLDPHLEEEKRVQFIGIIRRSGEQLVALIDDILDLSKVEAGKLQVEKHPSSIKNIMNEILALLNSKATEKGLELTVHFDEPLPDVIQTDPVRLRQILINVIGNAIKFTEKGQVEVQLSLSKPTLDAASGQLVFTVRDTGTGISPERQPQLFQAFVQADQSIARVYGGTGLGLVLSRRLARALGGEVELVSSQPGQGSTFRITVDTGPLNEGSLALVDAEPNLPSPAPIRTPKAKEQLLSGLRVLVVDDSPENRLLIDRILARRGGAHVESVEDGLKAIEAALQGSYDVVLMDMQMPQMDGFEATATLRRKGYQKPIIALTAHAMKEERTRCLAAGCDDFLGKPIDSHQLFEKLIHYTGAHRPRAPKKAPHNYEHRH